MRNVEKTTMMSDRRSGGRQECIPGEPQGSIRWCRGDDAHGAQRGGSRGKTSGGAKGEAREGRGHTKVSPAQAGAAARHAMRGACTARMAWTTGRRRRRSASARQRTAAGAPARASTEPWLTHRRTCTRPCAPVPRRLTAPSPCTLAIHDPPPPSLATHTHFLSLGLVFFCAVALLTLHSLPSLPFQ